MWVACVTGLRESKKQATRQRLEAVAFELFLRQGYDQTSVTDVAAAAQVSERTFFRYYASKQDVLFAGLDEGLELFVAALHDALVAPVPRWADVIGALRRYAEILEPTWERNRQRARLVRATASLHAAANQQLAEWRYRACATMAARYGRSVLDEEIQLLAGLTSAVLASAMTAWVEAEGTTLADTVDRMARRARAILRGAD